MSPEGYALCRGLWGEAAVSTERRQGTGVWTRGEVGPEGGTAVAGKGAAGGRATLWHGDREGKEGRPGGGAHGPHPVEPQASGCCQVC